MRDLVPSRLWQPLPSVFDDDEWPMLFQNPSGLSVSEDESKVYVETQIPGVDPKDIEITFDDGVLWVRGETKKEEENKSRKYYRRASSSFSYRVSVPADVDQNADPEAVSKNGIMTITFSKFPKKQPRKIAVKAA